jgi:hypothetical protein
LHGVPPGERGTAVSQQVERSDGCLSVFRPNVVAETQEVNRVSALLPKTEKNAGNEQTSVQFIAAHDEDAGAVGIANQNPITKRALPQLDSKRAYVEGVYPTSAKTSDDDEQIAGRRDHTVTSWNETNHSSPYLAQASKSRDPKLPWYVKRQLEEGMKRQPSARDCLRCDSGDYNATVLKDALWCVSEIRYL